jgi:sugar phosphate isomerase/epimerase
MENLGVDFISFLGMPPAQAVRLAGELGCRSVSCGLKPMDYNPEGYPRWSLLDPVVRRELKAAMAESGVSVALGEGFLVQPGADVRVTAAANLEAMADLDVKQINSVSFEPDFQRNVDQFGRLAETAAAFGIETLIEFVPIFAIADLATAHAVVRAVGRADCGLMIDTMHLGRTGVTAKDLTAIDPAHVGYIQLCDVPLTPAIPDYMDEAMHQRLAPGDGELPLLEMLSALPRDRIVSLEVPLRSEAEAGIGARERIGRTVEAARALLARLD